MRAASHGLWVAAVALAMGAVLFVTVDGGKSGITRIERNAPSLAAVAPDPVRLTVRSDSSGEPGEVTRGAD
jgi:hypothetical protein